jgi:hypothetical protein
MASAKCPECGFVGWADAESCKKCGAPMMAASGLPSDQMEPAYAYDYTHQHVGFQPELKQGLAITALVIGILNFLFLGIFVVTIIAGIVISVVALRKIKRYPLVYGGQGLAVAGLITNIVSVVVLIPILLIASIALPNLLAARMAANEGSAMYSLRQILAAEAAYQNRNGKFGTLAELERENLIASDLASGMCHGYKFKVDAIIDRGDGWPGFAAVGVPVYYRSSGRRSFFIDETGVIRSADSQGMDATKYDPPVNSDSRYPSDRSASRRSQPSSDY